MRRGREWIIDGQRAATVAAVNGVVTVFDGYGLVFHVVDPLDRAAGAQGDGNLIEAPMPGLVRSVDAVVGQAVAKGDRLAVLEAMKMETEVRSSVDGTVATIAVSPGDSVVVGDTLVIVAE